jgi:hypothetical protein
MFGCSKRKLNKALKVLLVQYDKLAAQIPDAFDMLIECPEAINVWKFDLRKFPEFYEKYKLKRSIMASAEYLKNQLGIKKDIFHEL